MTKCEVIDLTPSDSGSDNDFIQATSHFCTYRIRFCIKFLYIKLQVPATTEIILQDSVHVVVMHCSLAKSGRLICIARSQEFRFATLTSVRAKRFTGSSGKTSLNVFQGQAAEPKEDSCAATQSSCWEATVDRRLRARLPASFPYNFLCETTLLSFRVPFRVPAFRLSQLPQSIGVGSKYEVQRPMLCRACMLLKDEKKLISPRVARRRLY